MISVHLVMAVPAHLKGMAFTIITSALFAISRPTLDLTPSASAFDVLQAAQSYLIQETELIGTYQR
jgi:phosphatidylethanolamine-binding protein (PEBP) family uncharacterized protein